LDANAAIARALRNRPDLEALRIALYVDDLQIQQTANQLRPDLELTGNYTSQGLGGVLTTRLATAQSRPSPADLPIRFLRYSDSDIRFTPSA